MGHGYLAIVGFGIVVNIKDFLKVFPESFVKKEEEYEDDDRQIDFIQENYHISLHYEKQNSPDNIFICTEHCKFEDARLGGHQELKLEEIEKERPIVENFVKDKFPDRKVKLILFAYQDN